MSKIGLNHANIIEILGIESLPADQRKEILNTALELVENETLNKILEMTKKEDRVKLFDLIEERNILKLGQFLGERGIDLLEIIKEETEKVKESLLQIPGSQ